jgi:hypothetical protein
LGGAGAGSSSSLGGKKFNYRMRVWVLEGDSVITPEISYYYYYYYYESYIIWQITNKTTTRTIYIYIHMLFYVILQHISTTLSRKLPVPGVSSADFRSEDIITQIVIVFVGLAGWAIMDHGVLVFVHILN